jgi:hypothetical protein
MIVLHGGMRDGQLRLWGETPGPPQVDKAGPATPRGRKPAAPRPELLPYDGGSAALSAANHVFHFDRWWNPAAENQATNRVFRIGQTRNVQVHKFLCLGALEEKIAEMSERKKEVAENVIGTGEGWLTELLTTELKGLFALRKEAVAREDIQAQGVLHTPRYPAVNCVGLLPNLAGRRMNVGPPRIVSPRFRRT